MYDIFFRMLLYPRLVHKEARARFYTATPYSALSISIWEDNTNMTNVPGPVRVRYVAEMKKINQLIAEYEQRGMRSR